MKSQGKICFANKGKNKPDQDVSWYTSKSDAAIQAAQLGFTNATGASIDYAGSKVETIPGICAIKYTPSIGENYVSTQNPLWGLNPFNQAVKRIYTQMRRKNTASTVYSSPDLGVYLMCVDSLYNYFSYFARAYKLVNYYRNKNKYTAAKLFEIMNIDYEDFVNNLADVRVYLNSFALRVNASLSVPNLPIFSRHVWINSHIWKDGDTDKSQLYFPMIQRFHEYKFDKTEAGGGTIVITSEEYNEGDPLTVESIKRLGEELLNVLLNDDDTLLIAADIDKWYGGNQFILPVISETDKLEPEFSMEVLTQIQNIDALPLTLDSGLEQNANLNTVAQKFGLSSGIPNGVLLAKANRQFITMPYDNPKPEDIVVATRNTISLKLTGTVVDSITMGSEFVYSCAIFTIDPVSGNMYSEELRWINFAATGNEASDIMNTLKPVVYKTFFDMSPKAYVLPTTAENIAYAVTEFENSTPISYDRLNQIHVQALYNEFGFYDTDHSSSNF